MARLRTPYDKITAKECMKRFSDMAYSTSYIDIFQKGVEILYGPEFRVTIDLSKRMQFSCQICNRDMNSENAMAEHFRSGIHQKNLDKKGRLSDEVTYLARSSRYAKDSIHFRLITSQTAPIGLQFIEQYVGSKGTSYFKCFLCGAHGKMDTMYHHIIGNKHAEKYIKMSCILSDSILTSNERQQFRLFLKDSEGVNVDQIITIKGNAYYPFKWEMEGTPMKIGNCKIKKEIKYERSPSPGPSWKESPSLRSRRGWSTSSSRNSISPPRKRSKSKSKMQSKRQSRSPSDRWTRSPSRRRDRSPSRRRDRSPSRRRDRSPSRRRDRSPSRRRDRSPSRRRDRSPSRRRDRSPSRRRDRSPSRRRGRSPSRKRGRSPSRRSRSSSDSMERKRHRSKRRSRSSSGSMERKRHRSKRRSSSSSGSMERKRHRSRRNRHSSSSSSSSLSYSPKRYKQSDVKHEPSTSTHIKQEPCSSSSIKDFWSSTIIKEEPCSSSNIKSEPLLSEQRNDGGDITAYRNKSPPPLLRVKTDLFPSQSPMQVKDEPHSPSFDGNGLSLIEPMKIKKEKVDAFTQTSDMSLEEIMNGLNGLCLEYYSGGGKLQTAQDIRDTLEQMEIIAKCLRELCVMRLNDGDDKIPEHFNFLLHQREKRDKTIGYIQKWFTPTWNKNFGANC